MSGTLALPKSQDAHCRDAVSLRTEIFVLNYNGRELLLECLPSIIEAAGNSPTPCPVTVIDNSSTDDSTNILKHRFPNVRVLSMPNCVLCSFNDAVGNSVADVVFLLNNDLKADKDFIAPLLKVFEEKEDAFLVGPQVFTFDGKQYEGSLSKMWFRFGLFGAKTRFNGHENKIQNPGMTMQAGFGAYKRNVFLKLGGFDDLYLPGTVEDSDICFRAWKAGYKVYYEPKSRMYHKGQATFKKTFGRSRLLAINQRNLYLFVWKNISDPVLWFWHLAWLLPRPLIFLLKGRVEFLWGFLWAFGRLPAAVQRRVALKTRIKRSDRDIFKISKGM